MKSANGRSRKRRLPPLPRMLVQMGFDRKTLQQLIDICGISTSPDQRPTGLAGAEQTVSGNR